MTELLILYVLLRRDFTMYAIHKRITELFGSFTNPSFGAIKPALTRLEKQEFITTTKVMSEGGRLAIFYSITKEGEKHLKKLLLTPMTKNPLQFFSEAGVRLACCDILSDTDKQELYNEITTKALLHKINAKNTLESEYISTNDIQKEVLKNNISEFENIVKLIENI